MWSECMDFNLHTSTDRFYYPVSFLPVNTVQYHSQSVSRLWSLCWPNLMGFTLGRKLPGFLQMFLDCVNYLNCWYLFIKTSLRFVLAHCLFSVSDMDNTVKTKRNVLRNIFSWWRLISPQTAPICVKFKSSKKANQVKTQVAFLFFLTFLFLFCRHFFLRQFQQRYPHGLFACYCYEERRQCADPFTVNAFYLFFKVKLASAQQCCHWLR